MKNISNNLVTFCGMFLKYVVVKIDCDCHGYSNLFIFSLL